MRRIIFASLILVARILVAGLASESSSYGYGAATISA